METADITTRGFGYSMAYYTSFGSSTIVVGGCKSYREARWKCLKLAMSGECGYRPPRWWELSRRSKESPYLHILGFKVFGGVNS